MKPSEIIATARLIVLDVVDNVTAPRQSDTELLGYVNDGVKEICTFKPMVFATVAALACTPGRADQTLTFANAVMLLDVLRVTNGAALTKFDRPTLDLFSPAWRSDAAGPALQWSALEGDLLSFFIYPQAPAAQSLDVRYVRNPAVYLLTDDMVAVPDVMGPALVDYVVYRAESKDDENVSSARAVAHFAAFKQKIGVANAATVQ